LECKNEREKERGREWESGRLGDWERAGLTGRYY
jgi:hypothetical protein